MENKFIRFAVNCEFPKLPQLLYGGAGSVSSPAYCWDGMKRKSNRRCVFQYTIAGYGYLAYHGVTYKVDAGKAFIYDLSIPDSCYFYPPRETMPWSFVYCIFSNFEDAVEQLNAKHGPVYDFGKGSFIIEKLIALLNSYESRNSMIDNFKSYSLCAEIIGEMCRIADQYENSSSRALVTRVRAIIHEMRLQQFSLKNLSARMGVRPEHLCREFKRQLNSSPKHYHETLRAESVCERLLCGDSIKEVANDFGFDDISNFNKFFKKYRFMTPGQFKRNRALPLHDIFDIDTQDK